MLNGLPYPVVVIGEKGQILEKNRLARRLLPSGGELKAFLQKIGEKEEAPMLQATLSSVRYFVVVLPLDENRKRVCFLEHFLPFYESFSKIVLDQMNEFFWHLFPKEKSLTSNDLTPAFLDEIAARSVRLRGEEKAYLRLLDMRSYVPEKRVSCSVSGFFRHLSPALSRRGMKLDFTCSNDAAVLFSTAAFTHLVLNLVQFAYLFEGAGDLKVQMEETNRKIRLRFSFPDHLNFSFLCRSLLEGETEKIPEALLSSPMFCVLCLCRKEKLNWSLSASAGRLFFEVSIPKAELLPSAFLSDTSAEEVKELLRLEKEWFSR